MTKLENVIFLLFHGGEKAGNSEGFVYTKFHSRNICFKQ